MTAYNLVGFQTRMTYGEQQRVFRMIPGLEEAEILRFGSVHRNTFVDAPRMLDERMQLRMLPNVYLAGQITGVEGYVESAAIGLLAGRFAAAERKGEPVRPPPPTTALGALIGHITGGHLESGAGSFQPMNINYGLLPPLEETPVAGADGRRLKGKERGMEKKRLMSRRALRDLDAWLAAREPAEA